MTQFIVVDWRPYELPEVYGPFFTEDWAKRWAIKFFGEDTNMPDGLQEGIIVKQLVNPK